MRFALTPAQDAYQRSVRVFATDVIAPHAAAIDASNQFPIEVVERVSAQGLMGVTIPVAAGGAGLDYVSYVLAVEEISAASATVGAIVGVNNSLVAELIAQFGSDVQKARWLARLASGSAIGAFALSERDAGTDAANQQTTAQPDERQRAYRLTGRKVWVANAQAAALVVVFAATTPDIGGRGVSAFLVPLDTAGVTRTEVNDSLGVRGLGATDLVLEDVLVGSESLVGEPGQGFQIAMWALDGGRVAIAAQALGIGRAAFREALDYAERRKTFGKPIAEYQAIQWMLADMATELDAARMLVFKAAVAKDQQERCTLEAAMAKLAASEAAHLAADLAMQIFASAGYRRGSVVERLFRDARATQIYQGTSEVQRMIIAARTLVPCV